MVARTRSFLFRYGLALVLFGAVLGVALLLKYLDVQLNLTIPVGAALVAASWFGGRGPGIFFVVLVLAFAALTNRPPEGASLARVWFGYLSVAALLVLVALLVSGRRRTERRLREQSDLFRITLASIGDAVITTDADGKVTFLNATAERLLGWSASEASGKPLGEVFDVVDPDTGESAGDPFDRIRREGKAVSFSSNVSLRRRDGGLLPIVDSGAAIVGPDGAFVGCVIVFQDDSSRREAEKTLIETEHRQQQSQKLEAIGTLTGGVAHDFNNLLTAIIGYTQLAMQKLDADGPAAQNLRQVEDAGLRAAELTKKLLTFSRRQRVDSRVIDLNVSIDAILRLLKRVIGAGIQVSFRPAGDLALVSADPAQIEQVVMNLCLNARDAMPDGGHLTIETRNVRLDELYCSQHPTVRPGEYAMISVTDEGCGMERDVVDRIFEPFFSTKDVDKGTGLGLSVVFGIVKQHGGHINVYSEPGVGSTFKVYLPVAEAIDEPSGAPVAEAPAAGSETILLAEDEEALRALSIDVLASLGYEVIVAKNGEEAIDLYVANRDRIDLLLLDVVMPITGGIKAYETITELGGDRLPAVFMTGYSTEMLDPAYHRGKLDLDSVRVLQKPYTIKDLTAIVREALDQRPL